MPLLCLQGWVRTSIMLVCILTLEGWSSVCGSSPESFIAGADWPEEISKTLTLYGEYEEGAPALRGVRTFFEAAGDDALPACQVTDALIRSSVGCQLFYILRQRLMNDPPDFSVTVSFKQPLNIAGTLPVLLLPLLPGNTRVDGEVVAMEKATYYWYLRVLVNLYHHAYFTYRQGLPEGKMAAGWGQEREYMHLQEGSDERFLRTPMAASIVKSDRMVIMVRGTLSSTDWTHDFDYKFAPLESTRPYLGENRVHNGNFRVFKALLCEITEEVERVKPRVITVTGHSLGGAVASMLALHLQKRFLVQTEAVLFGAPSAGDENFVRDLSSSVEVRHILYVGRGWDADEGRRRFTIGDMVVQFGCAAMPGCPILDTGGPSDEYKYVTYPHLVSFTPFDLPNSHSWVHASRLVSIRIPNVIANHICSYMCHLASHVGDTENWCYFEYDEGSAPSDSRCILPLIPL